MANRYELDSKLEELHALLAKAEREPAMMQHPGERGGLYDIACDAVVTATTDIRERLAQMATR